MIDIINNNPYRVLGVFATSRTAEIVANRGRITAFLRVGRTCDFPLDLPSLLPPVVRTEESVADTNARLTLPQDQLKYAQFWFVKGTSHDDIAFNRLLSGNMEQAVEIWEKRDNASSLQNRIVCALANGSYGTAIQCAEKLYTEFSKEFVAMVLGENATISADNLHETFLDVLLEKLLPTQLSGLISQLQWKEYVAKKSTKPLIDSILAAVETTKASKGQGPKARFDAGIKLMNDTKAQLAQLKSLLLTSDLQYQMVADKLGQEILQCGIDYYNDSEEPDAALKAMPLQEYALKIVVGQMAKERCKENVDILKKIISELPPKEVFKEDKAIKNELKKPLDSKQPIAQSLLLLKVVSPHLNSIKNKLGKKHQYYIKTTILIANYSLACIAAEIKSAQDAINAIKKETEETRHGYRIYRDDSVEQYSLLNQYFDKVWDYRTTLEQAWAVIQQIDKLKLDKSASEYHSARKMIEKLCSNEGIRTLPFFTKKKLTYIGLAIACFIILCLWTWATYGFEGLGYISIGIAVILGIITLRTMDISGREGLPGEINYIGCLSILLLAGATWMFGYLANYFFDLAQSSF